MATQMAVRRSSADFGELRQRVEEMFRSERRFGSFSRSTNLPAGVKPGGIQSTTKKG
jgi:HSP20 family molecular chaperone IbpA